MRVFIKINQQAQGSRRAGNHFQQAPTSKARGHTNQGHEFQGMQVTTSNQHEPARHEETPTSKARGSRYAGNHFQPARTSKARTRDTSFKACR